MDEGLLGGDDLRLEETQQGQEENSKGTVGLHLVSSCVLDRKA